MVAVFYLLKVESLFFMLTLAIKSTKAIVSLIVCSVCCRDSKCHTDIRFVLAEISFGCTLQLCR